MGIVKAPCYSMEVSGNVGDICFSRMPSGAVVRSAWTGTQTSSADQITQRAKMTDCSKYWSQTLTESEREAWRQAAKSQIRMNRLQIPYRISGYQYFMQLSLQGKYAGSVIPKLPPIVNDPVLVVDMQTAVGGLTVKYIVVRFLKSLSPLLPPDSDYWQCWRAGPFDGGGRRPMSNEWRVVDPMVTIYYSLDYDIVLNKYYWYRARYGFYTGIVGNYWQRQQQYVV